MECVRVLSMDLLFGKPYASLNLPASNNTVYFDRPDLSANQISFRKREAVCIRRATESLILEALLEQGLGALEDLETYSNDDIRTLPSDALNEIILPWVTDEFGRTEQESQAEWEEHPYVKMGVLQRLA